MLLSKTQSSLTYLISKLSRDSLGKLLPTSWIASTIKMDPYKVHDLVDSMIHDTQFFRDTSPISSDVARFHHDEIETGEFLGEEYFSESHEVIAIYREEVSSASEEQEALRIELTDIVMYKGRSVYAIKQVNTRLQTQDEVHVATARLLLEAKYLSRIKHPNIIRFHGMVSSGVTTRDESCYDDLAILTDRISETLEQRIERWNGQDDSDLNIENQAVIRSKTRYMLQIAEAISYLHSHRLALRNLSSRTIGFADNDVITLINLENMIQLPEDDPAYLEHVLKADVYAWAVTFFEMLVQRPLGSHCFATGSFPDLEGCGYLPYNVQDLLANALSKDVKDRLDIDEVVERLEWISFGFDVVQEAAAVQYNCPLQDSSRMEEVDEASLGLDLDTVADEDLMRSGFVDTTSSFLPCHLLFHPEQTEEPLELSNSSSEEDLQSQKHEYPFSFQLNALVAFNHGQCQGVYEMARCA